MAKAAEQIRELIAPTVEALGVDLWGVEYLSQGKHSVLRIYIDCAIRGVDVDDCERVSRQVSALLDVEDPISGEYVLEVSSPGLDRPLFTPDQYRSYLGSEIRLQMRMPVNGRRKFQGVIREVGEELLILDCQDDVAELPLTQIEKARLSF